MYQKARPVATGIGNAMIVMLPTTDEVVDAEGAQEPERPDMPVVTMRP